MKDLCSKEIRELHGFFEDWYRGSVEDSDVSFKRVEDVLAPEFELITSSGVVVGRDQLVNLLRAEHGSKPDLKMWVETIQIRLTEGSIALVTYEEHGTTAHGNQSTLITAVLRKSPGTPNNLAWVHIHEVRLPPQA